MAKNPLLIFTAPKAVNKRDNLPPFISSIQSPPFNIQADRVIPKVERLERKFAEYIELADTAEGFLPEKVLVLEVAGEIQGVANALARVKGFEYLSSALLEKSFDSEDYYTLSNDKHTPTSKAALATRRLAMLHETLQEMKELGYGEALSKAPDALILKAMIIHGAEQNVLSKQLISRHLDVNGSRTFKSDLNQYLGFGRVNESRIHFCHDNQATLLYTNVIEDEKAQDFFLPLPPSLAARTINRRLIVTVAWFSPVNHGHKDYRGAQLWASPPLGAIDLDELDNYPSHLKNGTVYHEVRRGNRASAFTKGDQLAIRINCYGRAGIRKLRIPYVVIVTLDTPGVELPIYEEVRAALEIATQQNA